MILEEKKLTRDMLIEKYKKSEQGVRNAEYFDPLHDGDIDEIRNVSEA